MPEFYFTFGFGQHHAGGSLSGHYTIIKAETDNDARAIMHKRRGNKWASSYPSRERAGVDKYNLTFIDFNEVTQQNGETY